MTKWEYSGCPQQFFSSFKILLSHCVMSVLAELLQSWILWSELAFIFCLSYIMVLDRTRQHNTNDFSKEMHSLWNLHLSLEYGTCDVSDISKRETFRIYAFTIIRDASISTIIRDASEMLLLFPVKLRRGPHFLVITLAGTFDRFPVWYDWCRNCCSTSFRENSIEQWNYVSWKPMLFFKLIFRSMILVFI